MCLLCNLLRDESRNYFLHSQNHTTKIRIWLQVISLENGLRNYLSMGRGIWVRKKMKPKKCSNLEKSSWSYQSCLNKDSESQSSHIVWRARNLEYFLFSAGFYESSIEGVTLVGKRESHKRKLRQGEANFRALKEKAQGIEEGCLPLCWRIAMWLVHIIQLWRAHSY